MAGISTVEMPDDSGWSSPPFPSTVLLDENVGTRTSLDVDSLALSLRVGAAHPILELFSTPLMEQIVPWGSMDVSFSSGWGFNAWKTLVKISVDIHNELRFETERKFHDSPTHRRITNPLVIPIARVGRVNLKMVFAARHATVMANSIVDGVNDSLARSLVDHGLAAVRHGNVVCGPSCGTSIRDVPVTDVLDASTVASIVGDVAGYVLEQMHWPRSWWFVEAHGMKSPTLVEPLKDSVLELTEMGVEGFAALGIRSDYMNPNPEQLFLNHGGTAEAMASRWARIIGGEFRLYYDAGVTRLRNWSVARGTRAMIPPTEGNSIEYMVSKAWKVKAYGEWMRVAGSSGASKFRTSDQRAREIGDLDKLEEDGHMISTILNVDFLLAQIESESNVMCSGRKGVRFEADIPLVQVPSVIEVVHEDMERMDDDFCSILVGRGVVRPFRTSEVRQYMCTYCRQMCRIHNILNTILHQLRGRLEMAQRKILLWIVDICRLVLYVAGKRARGLDCNQRMMGVHSVLFDTDVPRLVVPPTFMTADTTLLLRPFDGVWKGVGMRRDRDDPCAPVFPPRGKRQRYYDINITIAKTRGDAMWTTFCQDLSQWEVPTLAKTHLFAVFIFISYLLAMTRMTYTIIVGKGDHVEGILSPIDFNLNNIHLCTGEQPRWGFDGKRPLTTAYHLLHALTTWRGFGKHLFAHAHDRGIPINNTIPETTLYTEIGRDYARGIIHEAVGCGEDGTHFNPHHEAFQILGNCSRMFGWDRDWPWLDFHTLAKHIGFALSMVKADFIPIFPKDDKRIATLSNRKADRSSMTAKLVFLFHRGAFIENKHLDGDEWLDSKDVMKHLGVKETGEGESSRRLAHIFAALVSSDPVELGNLRERMRKGVIRPADEFPQPTRIISRSLWSISNKANDMHDERLDGRPDGVAPLPTTDVGRVEESLMTKGYMIDLDPRRTCKAMHRIFMQTSIVEQFMHHHSVTGKRGRS